MLSAVYKKIIPSALLTSLVISSFIFVPQKSEAQFIVEAPVTDALLTTYLQGQVIPILAGLAPGEAQKEGGLFGLGWDGIAYYAARIMIRQITQSIVNWINSGFQGNPSFVQDPQKFLADTADRTVGEFIYDSDLQFLCEPFNINVRLALGLQYSPFQDKIRCRLTDILANSENAYNNFVNGDFIGGGGWESWLSITTVPQNNQLGALLIAQSELDARINEKSLLTKDELNWSGGILSQKECTETVTDYAGNKTTETYKGDPRYQPNGVSGQNITTLRGETRGNTTSSTTYNVYTDGNADPIGSVQQTCKIITPGSMITDQLKKVTNLDLEALNIADEINEIVGALANFVITKVMQEGFALINNQDLSPDNPNWRQGLMAMRSQQYQNVNSGSKDVNYQPQLSSSVLNTGSNSGSNNNQPTSTGDQALDQVKTTLINSVNAYLVPEQNYLSAYASVSNNATTTKNKLETVIACYNTKLANNSLNLTTGERNIAQSLISQASSTIAVMNGLIATTSPNIVSSLAKVTSLQTIKNTLLTATTAAVINTASADLTAVAATLHTTAEIANAQTYSTNTLSQIIIPNMTTADSLQIQCNAFPVR